MKSAKEAIQSAKNVVAFPKPPARRQRDEIAFLPAALEIVETPPSPIGRAMGATLIAVFCLGLIWACFGHVDIVATATGKVVPNGRVKLIQPFETGVVRAIEIRDGQSVKAGDVLIELDPTMSTAEEEHIKNDLMAARLDVARLRAGLSDADDPQAEFNPPAGASPAQVKMQQAYLAKQVEEHRAKIATLDRQQAQKQAERDTAAAAIQKLEASSPIIKERVDIRKYLVDKELGSRLTYLETLQQLTENQKDLVVQKSRLQETDAALAGIISTRQQTEAEFRRTLFSELNEAERKAGGLADDLSKAERRTKLQLLTAPVDGVVQQLAVHTVGGVVTPAQQLAVVVPADAALEVEAMVSNRDIGFDHKDCVPCDFRRVGLHRATGYILGVDPREEPPRIALADERRPIADPYVCIAVQSTLQAKYWNNPTCWAEIVRFLKESGYRVICIDLKSTHGKGLVWTQTPPGAEDQTGDQPLIERARWLKHAEFFIGLSSGLSWLAWSMRTPVVMISGVTHPINEFTTPYRVINYHACNSCWNDPLSPFDRSDFLTCPRHKDTPRQFECSRLITAEQVKQTIRRIPGFGVSRRAVA